MFGTNHPCAPEDDVLEDGSASLADSEEESEHEECGNDAPLHGVEEGVEINSKPLFKHYNRAYYNVHPDAVERNYGDPQKVATKENLFALTRDFAAKGKFNDIVEIEQQAVVVLKGKELKGSADRQHLWYVTFSVDGIDSEDGQNLQFLKRADVEAIQTRLLACPVLCNSALVTQFQPVFSGGNEYKDIHPKDMYANEETTRLLKSPHLVGTKAKQMNPRGEQTAESVLPLPKEPISAPPAKKSKAESSQRGMEKTSKLPKQVPPPEEAPPVVALEVAVSKVGDKRKAPRASGEELTPPKEEKAANLPGPQDVVDRRICEGVKDLRRIAPKDVPPSDALYAAVAALYAAGINCANHA